MDIYIYFRYCSIVVCVGLHVPRLGEPVFCHQEVLELYVYIIQGAADIREHTL